MGEFRASADGLKRMLVSSQKLGWVSLDNLVRVEEALGLFNRSLNNVNAR